MKLNSQARFMLLLPLLFLTGCSFFVGEKGLFHSNDKDYLKTDVGKDMTLPEGMETASLEPLYAVPEVSAIDEFGDDFTLQEYEIPRPDPVNTDKGKVGVKIQKLEGKRWVYLNASTSQVWPRAQNFLSEYGIAVVKSDPVIGLIETGDVVFKDDESRKSRFRLFLEKGVHADTTEVHILQADFAADEEVRQDFVWPSSSQNVDRENGLLDELATVLAKSVDNNSASLLGQNVGGKLKVEYARLLNEPSLRFHLSEIRAKATVSHSLKKEGFVLWDEDASTGLFYAGFSSEEDKPGFFKRMLFMGGDKLPEEAPATLVELTQQLQDSADTRLLFADIEGVKFVTDTESEDEKPGYIMVLQTNGKAMDLVVRRTDGTRVAASEAKSLLKIIRKNLI